MVALSDHIVVLFYTLSLNYMVIGGKAWLVKLSLSSRVVLVAQLAIGCLDAGSRFRS